jgi:hypothetical protein
MLHAGSRAVTFYGTEMMNPYLKARLFVAFPITIVSEGEVLSSKFICVPALQPDIDSQLVIADS